MKRKIYPFYFLIFWFTTNVQGQNFIIPDTVCAGEIVAMEYTRSAESFCLNFDANFLNYDVFTENIVAYPEDDIPLFIDIVQDEQGNYYSFSTNTTGNIIRLEFGDNLLNTPTAFSFPINEVEGEMEGIQIVHDDNQWWGFITGGGTWAEEHFARLNFGNSLSNIPTVENLGSIGNIQFPHDLFFTNENDNWISIIINRFNNSITRLEFGNNLANTPTATNLGNVGNLNNPTGFFPIKVDDAWSFFITNTVNNSLSRVDFGSSLLNTPSGINHGALGELDLPRDVLITKTCDNYIGLVLNRTNSEIILLQFGTDITSIPFAFSLGNFGDFDFPHSISNLHVTEEGIIFFICNAISKELTRVFFKTPDGFEIDCQENLSDFELVYDNPGTYELQVTVDQGLSDQVDFCKDIIVLPHPVLDIGNDTTLCQGASLILDADFDNTIWQDQTRSSSLEVFETQQYVAEVTNQGCAATDTIFVEFIDCKECIVFPNVFTPNGDGVNDVFKAIFACDVELIEFQLEIFNRWGQKVFESNNPLIGWDGNFKNSAAASEVYAWATNFTYTIGQQEMEEIRSGNLTLIR